MSTMDLVLQLAKKNNGMVTTSLLQEHGILRGTIKYLYDNNYLEKVSRGMYVIPGVFEDEFVVFQNRFKKGIYSLETALFLHGLTDRTPSQLTMTFPKSYNTKQVKLEGIRSISAQMTFYESGIEEVSTPSGNVVKAYCKEKVLADILRSIHRVDIQIISSAFKQYTMQKDKNIPLLSKYAKLLGVENKLKNYLEVLL